MIYPKLLKFISLNNSYYNNIEYIKLSNITNKSEIEENLINHATIKKYYEVDILESIKLLYFNRESIHDILYNKDVIYQLPENEIIENLSFYFYLILLIKESSDKGVVDFKYSINYIKNIFNIRKETKGIYRKRILLKIVSELIKNYEDEEDDEIKNISNLKYEVENEIIKEQSGFNISLENIEIEQIYVEIILNLINKENLCDEEIFKEIDMESIIITKAMFKKLNSLLDNEEINNKYLIKEIKDLFNQKKIDFNYMFLKYILKDSIFIYQINFFLKTRNFFLKNKSQINEMNLNVKENKEKLDLIFQKIFDSDYYYNNKNKYCIDLNISNSNTNIIINSNSNTNIIINSNSKFQSYDDTSHYPLKKDNCSSSNIKESTTNNEKGEVKNKNNNSNNSTSSFFCQKDNCSSSNIKDSTNKKEKEEENKYNILSFYKNLLPHDKSYQEKYINGKKKITKYTAEFITEADQYYISVGTDLEIHIYDKSYKIFKVKNNIEDWVYNIIEDNSQIILCCKNFLHIISNKSKYKEIEDIRLNQIFLIKYINKNKNKDYCFCCENEFCYLNDLFSKIIIAKKYTVQENILLKSGILINNNLLIFSSNKVVSKGRNKLYMYIGELKEIELNEEYSFIFTPNGMAIIPFNSDEEGQTFPIIEREPKGKIVNNQNYKLKILLCACKKYNRKQKNGILLLNISIDTFFSEEKKNYFFVDTGKFEVYCICPLLKCKCESILNRKIEIKDTFYFLVGGFNPVKNKGEIKLYKLDYNEKSVDKIEFIQDLYTDKKHFKGPISCITQSKSDEKILISCWDGGVYLFKEPKIDIDLLEDNNLNFKSFFRTLENQNIE